MVDHKMCSLSFSLPPFLPSSLPPSLPPSCSNPHSVSSLLVQQLLHQFSQSFLATPPDSISAPRQGSSSEQISLREFLCTEVNFYLLLSVQIISKQVCLLFKLPYRHHSLVRHCPPPPGHCDVVPPKFWSFKFCPPPPCI